jgi:hypothetical protein
VCGEKASAPSLWLEWSRYGCCLDNGRCTEVDLLYVRHIDGWECFDGGEVVARYPQLSEVEEVDVGDIL